MGVGAGLDHVTLFDLLVEERVEGVSARAEGIDLTHEREYRKPGFSAEQLTVVTHGDGDVLVSLEWHDRQGFFAAHSRSASASMRSRRS